MVAFNPPANDGGSPITEYIVTCGIHNARGAASPITVRQLSSSASLTCTVQANNGIAISPSSTPSASVTPLPVNATLYYQSQQGDYIGGGRTIRIDPEAGYFFEISQYSPSHGAYSNAIEARFTAPNSYNPLGSWWGLTIVAPDLMPVFPGNFPYATRWPFQAASVAGLSFSGNGGGCNTSSGNFQVLELAYDPEGGVSKIAVDFEQHCEFGSAALFGQLRLNSAVPIDTSRKHINPVNFPAVSGAVPGTSVISAPVLISGIDVPVVISVTGGEYSIENGPFVSASGVVLNGQTVRVRLSTPNAANALASTGIDIGGFKTEFKVGTATGNTPQANVDPLLVIVAQPAAAGAESKTTVFSPATMSNLRLVSGNSTTTWIDVSQSGTQSNQSIRFSGPGGTQISTGTYEYTTRNQSSGLAYFEGSLSESCYSTYNPRVRLVVREATYLANGTPDKLALDFVVFCPAPSDQNAYVYGYLRLNSSLPIDYSMPYPVPFKFPFVANAAPSTSHVSATATVHGVNIAVSVSIENGEYSIDGGPFVAGPATISNGQNLRVRRTSAASANTVATAMLQLGHLAIPFSIGTVIGEDPQPVNGSLVALTGFSSSPANPVIKRVASPAAGMNIVMSKPNYVQVPGPIFVDVTDVLANGAVVWNAYLSGPMDTALTVGTHLNAGSGYPGGNVRFSASGQPGCWGSDANRTKLVVHEIFYKPDGTPEKLAFDFVQKCAGNNDITDVIGFVRVNSSIPIDHSIRLPAPFAFPDVTGATPGTYVVSQEAVIQGNTVPIAVEVTGGEYSIDGGAFTSVAGTVASGQRIRVRILTSAQGNTASSATLTAGERSATFRVGTATTATPQPSIAPLLVLASVRHAEGLQAASVFSPATFATFAATLPGSPGGAGGITSTQGQQEWVANFSGPGRRLLTPGDYIGATTDSSSATLPFFHVSVSNWGVTQPYPSCSYGNGTTRFKVHEVEYAVSGQILKLALDFVQLCNNDGQVYRVHGYLRFNSLAAIDYSITSPVPFAFSMAKGATPGEAVLSGEVTIKGTNSPSPVTIAGGEYSVDGGPFTSAPGTISSGQKLRLRVTASTIFNAVITAEVNVGGHTAAFSIGTAAGPNPQPNGGPFVYLISQGNETLGGGQTFLYSMATGASFSVSRAGGMASMSVSLQSDQFPFYTLESWQFSFSTPDGSTLAPGLYPMIARSASSPSIAGMMINRNVYGSCGFISGQFTVHEVVYTATGIDKLAIDFVQTCGTNTNPIYGYLRFNSAVGVAAIADATPTQFYFDQYLGAARSSVVTSNAVTPSGYNTPAAISVSGGEYSIDGTAFTAASGTLNPGQNVRMRMTAASAYGIQSFSTLTVGGVESNFYVTSEYADSYPNSFTFGFKPNVPLEQWVYSPVVTPSGFNTTIVVTINGGEFSVGGRPFTSAPSAIQPGETIQVRLMSSTAYYDYRVSLLSIGGFTAQFSIQTLAQVGLTIGVSGSGSVTSAPAGIACPGQCSTQYLYGTSVTLSAIPGPGMVFGGWSGGGCTGNGTCTLTVNNAMQILASFAPAAPPPPILVSAIPGDGTVTLHFAAAYAAGHLPVTGFTATCGAASKSTGTSPVTITGLANGMEVNCQVSATSGGGTSAPSNTLTATPSAAASLELVGVVSRMSHGSAGVFDLPIRTKVPLAGAVSVEPRSGFSGHMIVFQFNAIVSAATALVTNQQGATVTPSSFEFVSNEVRLRFDGLPDKTRLSILLSGINGAGSETVSMGFLLGDVNGSQSVDLVDQYAVKSQSGQTVHAGNYFYNISASGTVTARDLAVVKARRNNTLLSP